MGFLDKAKKMAEQAQAKIDEAQKQFNERQGQQQSGPAVEYDAHGRPIAQDPRETSAPPHGDPLASAQDQAVSSPPAPAAPTPGVPPTGHGDPVTAPPASEPAAPPPPGVPPTDAPAPEAPPARPEADAPPEDRNRPRYEPPKLSSGDPLAG